ncbi:MAG: hypothetical protein AAGC65_01805 [Mucilaginibacter sp.]|uniref:hypothetical protein n=1 Tax=Mucilaginibacter sp. TaxID=1882438 RepID=UPI0031A1D63F
MTQDNYRILVLENFDQQAEARLLPQELVSPTRKNLKAHALHVCTERFDPKDELMLRAVFGKKDNREAYIRAIEISSAEKFRTLNNFLNDREIYTDFKNISLLAWLIDFQPRPFHHDLTIPDKSVQLPPRPTTPGEDPPTITKAKVRRYLPIFYALASLLVLTAGYLLWDHNKVNHALGCMIWAADHYEATNCKEIPANTTAYPVNQQLIQTFRKITQPDTLTLHSIGKVWYAKHNGRVEFFTCSGIHPLDTNKRLLPMSVHILEKYVYHITN